MPFLGPLFQPVAENLRQSAGASPYGAGIPPSPGQEIAPGVTFLAPSRANPDVRRAEVDTPGGSSSLPQALFGRLEQGIQSPLFLAGLGLMANGPSGMMQGIKTGASLRPSPLERALKEAQINEMIARTGYYDRRTKTGGVGSSATERMIDRLRDEDPDLSYGDAVSRIRRTPNDDTLARERLAVQASRNDPSRTLEEWRSYYGLAAPTANRRTSTTGPLFGAGPSSGPEAKVGTRENPIVPRSQAEIDNAPSGTVFSVDGKLMVK